MVGKMRVNEEGYVTRSPRVGRGRPTIAKTDERDWFLVKHASAKRGSIDIASIYLPLKYVGKKVKLKIEIMEDK